MATGIYKKVGFINKEIAQKAKITSANIYIDKQHIDHIQIKHGKELLSVGMDALTFVKCVCQNFNQIRKGSNESYLLVIFNRKLSFVAAMTLDYSVKDGFWIIKTAQPRRSSAVLKKALLWTDAQTVSRNGGGSH